MIAASFFYATLLPMATSAAALYAVWWRVRAAKALRGWAPLHLTIASLGVVYAVAYALLWTGAVTDRATWSEYMGTIGVFTIVIVWALPARKLLKEFQEREGRFRNGR